MTMIAATPPEPGPSTRYETRRLQWAALAQVSGVNFGQMRTWAGTPAGGLLLLILVTMVARLAFAFALGLGIDESYTVAARRTFQLGYFDHPPMVWWLAWSAAHLAGTDAAVVVRLPFVLLFALTTWLMYRVTATMFGARAGFWAAALLNLSPVFGVTVGTWVLPDGPLFAALLGAVACLLAALPAQGRAAWAWWLGAGLCAGLALFSKYTVVLSLAGAIVFLLTQPSARSWLRRPHPYAAGLIALLVFSPVLAWNAGHGWASLLFQGGRAGGRVAGSSIHSARCPRSRAEGTVNQLVSARMNKRQQMRWSPRDAHHVLQVRAALLDGRSGHPTIQLAA